MTKAPTPTEKSKKHLVCQTENTKTSSSSHDPLLVLSLVDHFLASPSQSADPDLLPGCSSLILATLESPFTLAPILAKHLFLCH